MLLITGRPRMISPARTGLLRVAAAARLAACAPTVHMHVHLSDQTLFDNHGVVRTDTGPIILEQLKRFLVQHDANIKIYPVIDPAETAPAWPAASTGPRPSASGDSKQPEPGTYLWRSPEDWIAVTTNQGTLTLGHTDWANQLWESAA
jgi:hypothetical protein